MANFDPDAMRQGDWLNMRDEVRELLAAPHKHGHVTWRLGPERLTREQLQDACNRVKRVVDAFAFARVPGVVGNPLLDFASAPLDPLSFDVLPGPAPSWAAISVQGEAPSLVAFAATLELASGGGRLRRCAECNTCFVRVRRQKYCSRRCTDKANKRAYLKTARGKATNREAARRHYQKKIRSRVGRATKIGRGRKEEGS